MFNEKQKEWSAKSGAELPVYKTPKYEESKKSALAIIEKYEDVQEGDFWILMNESKNKKMLYSGLIISHNGCLKINDALEEKEKFRPECLTLDKDGYGDSLVFTYICPEQGIYEVGEVSKANCKNAYPYAMALKRCFDRVILKISKLAFGGIYSEAEADEFREPVGDAPITEYQVNLIIDYANKVGSDVDKICANYKVDSLTDLTAAQYGECLSILTKRFNAMKGDN